MAQPTVMPFDLVDLEETEPIKRKRTTGKIETRKAPTAKPQATRITVKDGSRIDRKAAKIQKKASVRIHRAAIKKAKRDIRAHKLLIKQARTMYRIAKIRG